MLPLLLATLGCGTTPRQALESHKANSGDFYRNLAKQVDYADPQLHAMQEQPTSEPFTIEKNIPTEYWNLPLDEAIVLSLTNSPVLRDLGGQLLRSPAVVPSIHNPGIIETDPRFGIENALSAFDTSFNTKLFYEKNDRALNNAFFGGGTRILQQDLLNAQTSLTKTAATGTQFTVRHNTNYDANNAPGNLFPSAWDTNVEAEFRHPLLQGSGVEFNRIAGPGGQLGLFNGVVLARMNTDISLAEFETAVRNMIADVENGYWDLYYAYRDLQTKIIARDKALETWRNINALFVNNKRGGEADKEAQAREQYYRYQEEVENALTGQILEGTHTNNGSSGGTFRGTVGVQLAERRLRLVCGLPISDGRMIRPSDEPLVTKVSLDWSQTSQEALARRPELRRQRWVVKRREMELSASRNYLMPRLDAIGRYRFRGFGNDLLNSDGNTNGNQFDNAYDNLLTGNFQEWQLGVDMTVPIGFRRAHTAVKNGQLLLARERAVLHEQERSVLHDLSNAVADLLRAYAVTQTSYNRLVAARDQLVAVQSTYDAAKASLDLLLEAQRRNAEAEGRYYRALVEHATALRNVHFEKGTSLEYHNVYLNDDRHDIGPRRQSRVVEKPLNYVLDPKKAPPQDEEALDGPTAIAAQAAPNTDVTPTAASQPTFAPEPVGQTPLGPPRQGQPTLAPPQTTPPTVQRPEPTVLPIPVQIPSEETERPVAASFDNNAYDDNAAPRFVPMTPTSAGTIYPAAMPQANPAPQPSPMVAPSSSAPSSAAPNSAAPSYDGPTPESNLAPSSNISWQPSSVTRPQQAARPFTVSPAPAFSKPNGPQPGIVRPSGIAPPNTVAPVAVAPSAVAPGTIVRPTVVRLPLVEFAPNEPTMPQTYPTAVSQPQQPLFSAPQQPTFVPSAAELPATDPRPALPTILFGRDPTGR